MLYSIVGVGLNAMPMAAVQDALTNLPLGGVSVSATSLSVGFGLAPIHAPGACYKRDAISRSRGLHGYG